MYPNKGILMCATYLNVMRIIKTEAKVLIEKKKGS